MVLRDRDCADLVWKQLHLDEVTITREKCYEAFFWKVQNELKAWRKLQALNFTAGEQARTAQTRIEFQKVGDEMWEKFGHPTWMQNLAEEKYNLADDKRVNGLQRMLGKTKEDEQKNTVKQCSQPQEQITEMVKKGLLLGKPVYDSE